MSISRLLAALLMVMDVAWGAGAVAAAPAPGRPPTTPDAGAPPLTFYASVVDAGVFTTTGLGGPWQGPLTLPSSAQTLAAAAAAQWQDVYAGLADGVADGAYVSHDGGTTWARTALRGRKVYALDVDPHNADNVLAGTDRGIYRSTDGGITWGAVGGITRAVTTLAQAPLTPRSVYAASTGHAWSSSDGGRHWAAFGRGLPARASLHSLAVTATTPVTIYAATTQGAYAIRPYGPQAGSAWTLVRHGLPVKPFSAMVAPDPTAVYAVSSADDNLYVSTDGGATWSHHAIAGLSGGVTALVQDGPQPGTLIAGDANGDVLLSADDGTTWSVPAATVAGTVGSPVLALAVVQRRPVPADGVPDPHLRGVRWFPTNGGHTLRGAFLTFWQSQPDAAALIGYPLSEECTDPAQGGVRAQYFERMELLLQGGTVEPAPLGAQLVPAPYTVTTTSTMTTSYSVDPHFQSFWGQNGGASFFGPPESPAFSQTNGDGTARLYLVQYFRSARLEYHPEVASTGNPVEVGKLGEEALQALGWPQQ
jgi:photosystem II stability/assembly factor-like uncharacterized protein